MEQIDISEDRDMTQIRYRWIGRNYTECLYTSLSKCYSWKLLILSCFENYYSDYIQHRIMW